MEAISSSGSLPAPGTGSEAAHAQARRLLVLTVGLLVSGALLYLTVRKLEIDAVLTALRAADPARVALAVSVICCMYVVQALRWRWIARREARLSTWRFLQYVVGGVALNNAVPGRPGDLVRAHWLGRGANTSRANALGTVVVD